MNLVRPDAGRDETPLDRFAYRDNRGDSTSGVTEAIEPGERKAHAAVQDQDRDLHEQAGQQRERSRLSLLGVDDLDAQAEVAGGPLQQVRLLRPGVVRDHDLDAVVAGLGDVPEAGAHGQTDERGRGEEQSWRGVHGLGLSVTDGGGSL